MPETNTTENNTTLLPTVILPLQTKELTFNSEKLSINVRVVDDAGNPYSTGNVKIAYPTADVLSGKDIEYFDDSNVSLVNGVATFHYTAPKNLDANTSNIAFKFYHNSLPSSAKTFTMTLKPVANQNILTNYNITTNFPTQTIEMGIQSSKHISISVNAVNDNNNTTLISDANISSITIKLKNSALADLEDTTTTTSKSKTYTKNRPNFSIKTNTISGLIPLEVTANFKGLNNEDQNITQIFNVVVHSGPPTAMSLSYAGTTNDTTKGKFIDHWALTVTDKYNNLVDTKPAVSMGMITGYAQSSATTNNPDNYLYYDKPWLCGRTQL